MCHFSLKLFSTLALCNSLIQNSCVHSHNSDQKTIKKIETYQSIEKKQKRSNQKLKDIEFNFHKILSEIRRKLEAESKQNNIQTNLLEDLKKKIKLLELQHQEIINNLKSTAPTPKLNQKIEISQIIDPDAVEWVENLKKVYEIDIKKKSEDLSNYSKAQDLPTANKSVPLKTLNYDEQMINTNYTPYKSVREIIGENTEEHERQYD